MDTYTEFPAKKLPEDPHQARLLGIYPQRTPQRSFQRVRLPGGRIRAGQWQGLASLAAKFTPEYPLHVTTRQDVELHGVRPDEVGDVQQGIDDLGITGRSACGNSVRNITCCPSNGFRRGTFDVSDLAASIRECVAAISWISDLPRKFKISLCGCFTSCTRPWINDLGLVANRDGTFRAMVAGSLGSKPKTGLLFHDSLKPREIPPLTVALLRLFYDEGDRKQRHRARLRHVRERLGDARFRERVAEYFQEESANLAYSIPRVARVETNTPCLARLRLPLGDITGDDALELGRIVEEAGAELRIGLEHDLQIYGNREIELGRLQARLEGASIVACPGSTLCTKGIANSRRAAHRISCRISGKRGPLIAVSGCPNNCAHAAVAPIGLVGRIRKKEGRTVQGFQLLAGGVQGLGPEMGVELHPFVPADDVDEAVARIVQEYHENSPTDSPEAFSRFVAENQPELVEMLHSPGGPEGEAEQ